MIHQCGFANVRPPNNSDHAATLNCFICHAVAPTKPMLPVPRPVQLCVDSGLWQQMPDHLPASGIRYQIAAWAPDREQLKPDTPATVTAALVTILARWFLDLYRQSLAIPWRADRQTSATRADCKPAGRHRDKWHQSPPPAHPPESTRDESHHFLAHLRRAPSNHLSQVRCQALPALLRALRMHAYE